MKELKDLKVLDNFVSKMSAVEKDKAGKAFYLRKRFREAFPTSDSGDILLRSIRSRRDWKNATESDKKRMSNYVI